MLNVPKCFLGGGGQLLNIFWNFHPETWGRGISHFDGCIFFQMGLNAGTWKTPSFFLEIPGKHKKICKIPGKHRMVHLEIIKYLERVQPPTRKCLFLVHL